MLAFRLKRKTFPPDPNAQRRRAPLVPIKWLCTERIVYASSEQEARDLASVPEVLPEGTEVSEENTVERPYAWCYDPERSIWADPDKTTCEVVGDYPEITEAHAGSSAFSEVPRDFVTP